MARIGRLDAKSTSGGPHHKPVGLTQQTQVWETEREALQWPTPNTINNKSRRALTASTDNGRYSGGGQSSPPGLEQVARLHAGETPPEMEGILLPPRTRELIAGMWPTPDATVSQDGEDEATWRVRQAVMKAKGYNGNGCGTPLAMKAKIWPTPDAYPRGGAVNPNTRRPAGHSLNLQDEAVFWPTPNVPNGGRGLPLDMEVNGNTATVHGRKVQLGLHNKAENWPTPRVEDSECCGNHPGAMDSLHGVTKTWPTPTGHDYRSGEGTQKREGAAPLNETVTQWPTPMAYSFAESHLPGQVALDRKAKAWPTPATRDYKGTNGEAHLIAGTGRKHLDQLPNFVAFCFHLDPMTPTPGETSSPLTPTSHPRWPTMTTSDSHGSRNETSTRPAENDNHHNGTTLTDAVLRDDVTDGKVATKRQLNPMFVEWLMGWPLGWSQSAQIALTDSVSSATE